MAGPQDATCPTQHAQCHFNKWEKLLDHPLSKRGGMLSRGSAALPHDSKWFRGRRRGPRQEAQQKGTAHLTLAVGAKGSPGKHSVSSPPWFRKSTKGSSMCTAVPPSLAAVPKVLECTTYITHTHSVRQSHVTDLGHAADGSMCLVIPASFVAVVPNESKTTSSCRQRRISPPDTRTVLPQQRLLQKA